MVFGAGEEEEEEEALPEVTVVLIKNGRFPNIVFERARACVCVCVCESWGRRGGMCWGRSDVYVFVSCVDGGGSVAGVCSVYGIVQGVLGTVVGQGVFLGGVGFACFLLTRFVESLWRLGVSFLPQDPSSFWNPNCFFTY